MPTAKKVPVAKFRAGAMTTSVWENQGEKDGKTFSFNTIQVQRSYKDKEDKWVNETINLRKNDVANLNLVVSKAHETIVLKKETSDNPSE